MSRVRLVRPLTVALTASACCAGVFVTAAKAEPQAEHEPTRNASPGNGSVQGSLPPVGDESPVNRRDSKKKRSAVGRARDRRESAPPAQYPDRNFIDKFGIPPFLLPIYQAAGTQYGIRWEILAAINEIETDYGRNLNVSSAGAVGWMQFLPSTWRVYGVDADNDNVRDPYNPVDAIFAAARYLNAAGAESDIRKAVFAYNHADWYVDSVLLRAQVIGGLPSNLVGSLTGLTQGRFPVDAKATYAGRLQKNCRRMKDGRRAEGADRDLRQWAVVAAIAGLPLKRRLFANPTRPAVRAVLERNVETDVPGRGAARIDPKPILDCWKEH